MRFSCVFVRAAVEARRRRLDRDLDAAIAAAPRGNIVERESRGNVVERESAMRPPPPRGDDLIREGARTRRRGVGSAATSVATKRKRCMGFSLDRPQ